MRPRFLIYMRKAIEEFGQPSGIVMDFIVKNLSVKFTLPFLKLLENGELQSGNVDGQDCLESWASGSGEFLNVNIGPDSVATLSFMSV